MANYGNQDIQCPFYKKDEDKKINCEGAVTGICTQLFRSKNKKDLYKNEYCCLNYKNCPYYTLLYRDYERKLSAR